MKVLLLIFILCLSVLVSRADSVKEKPLIVTYDTTVGYCEIYSHNEQTVGKYLFPALAIFRNDFGHLTLIDLYIIKDNPSGDHDFLKLNLKKWYHFIPEKDIY